MFVSHTHRPPAYPVPPLSTAARVLRQPCLGVAGFFFIGLLLRHGCSFQRGRCAVIRRVTTRHVKVVKGRNG